MPDTNRHIIRRQRIELELPAKQGALELQRRVSRWYQERVVPGLDRLFSELGPPELAIRIPYLEVDLGQLSPERLEGEFIERCLQAIEKAVREQVRQAHSGSEGASVRPREVHDVEAYLHFLAAGHLPGRFPPADLRELETSLQQALTDRPGLVTEPIRRLLRRQPAALFRLARQASAKLVEAILTTAWPAPDVAPAPPQLERRVADYLGTTLTQAQRRILWEILLQHWAEQQPIATLVLLLRALSEAGAISARLLPPSPPGDGSPTEAGGKEALGPAGADRVREGELPQEPAPGAPDAENPGPDTGGSPKRTDPVTPEEQRADPSTDGEIRYIDNAGLVLLHPFLPTFFGELGLLHNRQFPETALQERAVHLLHFLATGAHQPGEHLLGLCKLLAGLPLAYPVARDLALTNRECTEAEELLRAVLHHWPALKNTSIGGLREGFLQRQGALHFREEQAYWRLRMERKGQDVLLEKLAWGMGIVQLPWMPHRMMVEW